MKVQYRSNLYAGCLAVVMAIIVFLLIPHQISVESQATHGITSRTMPYAMVMLMAGAGIALIFQSVVLKKDKVKELDLKKEGVGALYIICLLAYGIGFSYNFVISTILLGCVTLAFRRTRKLAYYGIVIAVVVGLYLIFTQLLHVQLP